MRNHPIERTCQQCGKVYILPPISGYKGRKFCSRECMAIAFRQRVPSVCSHCGQVKLVRPSHAKDHRFCSRSCGFAARKRPPQELFWEKVVKSEGCWLWT